MQPFLRVEDRSVRYWSKEINGTRGGRKGNFFLIRGLTMPPRARAAARGLILSIHGQMSLFWGRLGAVTIHG